MLPNASRSPFIDCRPKRFMVATTYQDHTQKTGTAPYAADLLTLRSRITQGLALEPRYYRQNIQSTRDQLLETLGIKHLHLGGQNSDVLMYLVEYDDYVVVLEINDRKHFRSDPVGVLLKAHAVALGHLEAAQAEVSKQERERAITHAQRTRSLEAAWIRAREGSTGPNTFAKDDLPPK